MPESVSRTERSKPLLERIAAAISAAMAWIALHPRRIRGRGLAFKVALIVALAIIVVAGVARGEPIDITTDPVIAPAEPDVELPAIPEAPPARDYTAAEVSHAQAPGAESGRIDDESGDSWLRVAGRTGLFVPKLAVVVALSPVRGLVWVNDRYQLEQLYFRVFFNADRTIGLYPTATYESGFGASAGARFVDRDVFGQLEHFAIAATTGAVTGEPYREEFLASFNTGHRLGRHLVLGIEANFNRRPSDPFYGIGNGDLVSQPSRVIDPVMDPTAFETYLRYQEERVAMSSDVRVFDHVHVLASGALTELAFSRSASGVPIDMVYDSAGLVGFTTGVRHLYGELELRWDTRRRVSQFEPKGVHSSGSLVAAFAGRVDQLDGGADFWRYGCELQHFFRIAKGPRALVLRFHGEGVTGSLDQVPFVELPELGGGAFLRGYPFERFRDRVAAFGSVQYEWDVSHLADAYIFADAGRVFRSLDNVGFSDMRLGFGIGAEVHSDVGFLFEATIASSIDGGVFLSASFNPVLDARARWR